MRSGTGILVAVCSLIVALGPLALSLARQDEYHATSSIAQSDELPQYTRAEQVAGVKLVMGAALGSRDVQEAIRDEVTWLRSDKEVIERVAVDGRWRERRPEATIIARASTSEDARALAVAANSTLSERAELIARLGDTYEQSLQDGGRAFNPPTPVRAEKEHPVDAVLAALPGALPPPPQPLWAFVAGLALAAALLSAVMALAPASRSR